MRAPPEAAPMADREGRYMIMYWYWSVYRIMLAEGLVTRSRARSRRRKWVRFERAHSGALWHVDWHMMKYGPLRGSHLIVFFDDASLCVTGFGVFAEATSANSVLALRKAVRRFGAPAQVLSDHGTQFTASRRGTPSRGWTPTLFERELLDRDMAHPMARVRHPQTNGKVERFFQTLEAEIGHFGGAPEFIEYYNGGASTSPRTSRAARRPCWPSGGAGPTGGSGRRTRDGWRWTRMSESTTFRIKQPPAHGTSAPCQLKGLTSSAGRISTLLTCFAWKAMGKSVAGEVIRAV